MCFPGKPEDIGEFDDEVESDWLEEGYISGNPADKLVSARDIMAGIRGPVRVENLLELSRQ